jgi:hypothetical protein
VLCDPALVRAPSLLTFAFRPDKIQRRCCRLSSKDQSKCVMQIFENTRIRDSARLHGIAEAFEYILGNVRVSGCVTQRVLN